MHNARPPKCSGAGRRRSLIQQCSPRWDEARSLLFALLTASPSPPAQCKELLRPVKKWLTVLQSPPAQGGKEEVLQQYKKVGGAAPPVARHALC